MSEEMIRYGNPPKQLNVRLPYGLHRELKVRCAQEGLSVAATMEGLVRAYLAKKAEPLWPKGPPGK